MSPISWRPCRVALLSLLVAACSDPARPSEPVACSSSVTLTVGAGTQPEISWTPRCGVVLLEVSEIGSASTPEMRWAVLAFLATLLEPPVRYGIDPPGSDILTLPATPLQSGHTYRAAVFRRGVALEHVEIGGATFTP